MEQTGISLKAYRTLDVFIFTLLTCAAELINVLVLKKIFTSELFSLSITIVLALIALERWNAWAVFVAAAGGLAYCIVNAGGFGSYVTYIFGNCFVLLNLLWYVKVEKKTLETSTGLKILFTLSGFLAAEVGRTVISSFFEEGEMGLLPMLWGMFKGFVVSDALNIVIGVIIVLIAGKQDGLFMDQLAYLKAIQAEREKNERLSSGGYNEEQQNDQFNP